VTGKAAGPLGEPTRDRLPRYHRQALATLAATGELAYPPRANAAFRRFMRWLEKIPAVCWDPHRRVWWVTSPKAITRLLRWDELGPDQRRALTTAYRTRKVAEAGEQDDSRSAAADGLAMAWVTHGMTWDTPPPPELLARRV
jgi:hypothetical protein